MPKFLLRLDKPLGASENHALAGRYATMLKSAPDFEYTFSKVGAGGSRTPSLLVRRFSPQKDWSPCSTTALGADFIRVELGGHFRRWDYPKL